MADDNRVYTLTFTSNVGQFSLEVNTGTRKITGDLKALENAEVSLTNVSSTEGRKRIAARKQESDAAANANKTRLSAINESASFVPATDRVITSTSPSERRQLAAAEARLDPFAGKIKQAEADVARFEKEIERIDLGIIAKGSDEAIRAVNNLALAYQRLTDLRSRAAIAGGAANENVGALDQAARSLRDQIDPLSKAMRNYGDALSLVDTLQQQNKITETEAAEATRLARFSFEETATSIRKEAETAYNALIEASNKLKAASAIGKPAGTPASTAVTSNLATSETLTTQLKTNVISGQKIDPLTLESTRQLTAENLKLAAAEEAAASAAQKVKDMLDPVAAIERNLADEVARLTALYSGQRLSREELTRAEQNANNVAATKIADITGATKLAQDTQKYKEQLDPTIPLVARLNAEIAKINTVTLDSTQKTQLLTRAYADYKASLANLPDAKNQIAMAEAAGRLKDQIDPIAAAYRRYGEAVAEADKLVASGNLVTAERDNVVKLAQRTFESTTNGIRKEAEATYAALKTARDNYINTTRGTTAATPTQITSANTLLPTLKTDIANPALADPKTAENARDLTNELKNLTAAQKDLNAESQRIKDTLDPVAAIERNLGEEIARLKTLIDPTRLSLDEFNRAEQNLRNAANIKIQDATGVTAAQDDYARLTKSAQQYRETLNPLLEAQRKYSAAINETKEFVSVGLVPQREASMRIDDYTKKLANVQSALQKVDAGQLSTAQITKQFRPILQSASEDFEKFTSTATRSFGLNRIGFLQLQAAGVNSFQALASGISPTRVAFTEGAQVIGAAIQGTNLSLKQFVAYAVPIAAVGVAFLGVVAAIGAAASKAQFIKELAGALEQFHRGASTTATDLEAVSKGFRQSGESASAVNAILAEIARNPTFDPAFSKQIISTSRDIGAAFGTDLTDGFKRLSTALEGGAQGIIDLGTRLGVLSPAQIAEILTLNRTVGAQAAVKKGYEDIISSLRPYTADLSPIARLTREITAAWNTFTDALTKSGPIQGALSLINKLTDSLADLNKKLEEGNKQSQSRISNTVSGALGGAAAGAVAGGIVTSPGIVTTPLGVAAGAVAGGVTGAVIGYNVTPTTTVGTSIEANVPSKESRFTATNVVIDTPDLERIARVLGEASKTLPPGYSAVATSTERTPGAPVVGTNTPSQHGFGRAMDVAIVDASGKRVPGYMSQDSTGQYTAFAKTATTINQQMFPGTTLISGTGFSKQDSGHFQTAAGGTTTIGPTTTTSTEQTKALGAADAELTKNQDLLKQLIPVYGLYGSALDASIAAINKHNEVLAATGDETKATAAGQQAASEVIKRQESDVAKQTATQELSNEVMMEAARITSQDEVQGLQATAKATATLANQQEPLINIQQRYNQLLATGAVEALNAGAKAIPALIEQTTASEQLAVATSKGADAEHQAVLENQAAVVSHNALAAARATGNQQLVQEAERLETVNLLLIRQNDIAQQSAEVRRTIQQNKDQSEVISLQLSLQGRTTEEITKQTSVLQTQQQIRGKYSELSEKDKQEWLDSVNAVQNMNIALIQAQRNTERINNLVLDIANNITDSLGTAIDNAFDQKKAKDWGETLKGVLKDVIKSASENLFIKPLLGSLATTLGFGAAGTSLGALNLSTGGIFGAAAAATETTTTSGTGTGTTTTNATGATTGSTVGTSTGTGTTTTNAGIGGSSTTGLLGLGGSLSSSTGTVTNWLNTEIGPALGFAKPETTVTTAEGTDFSSAASGVGGTTTTLTGALGGAATGLAVGGTVSSLFGGNTTTGSIGGAVGGAIGTAVGGPVGGLVGGAIGGLTGLFGNNTPSNNAAGADINLTTGKLSRQVTSPDSASNQDVKDITGSLKTFSKDLSTSLGKNIDANAQIQSGLRDGIKASLTVEGKSLGESKFADAQAAIDAIELDIVHNVSGLTDTMKMVLDKVTDPADITDAITFAGKYDDLKKAADSAFSSIEDTTDTVGVYATAMDDLNTTFDDLTVSANQFGLSLDPINKALDEATDRLRTDFKDSLDTALNTASSKDYINTLKDVSKAYASNIKEAKAIGLDTDTDVALKTSRLEVDKLRETLDTLTNTELNDVYSRLKNTNPEVAALAKVIIEAGTAADDAATSITTLKDGIKDVKDLATSLRTGKLSGLTDAAATTQAISQYNKDLDAAKTAGTNVTGTQLAALATSAEAAVNASLTAYGNAPKTADLRRQVLKDVELIESAAKNAQSVTTIPSEVKTEQTKIREDTLAGTTTTTKAATTTVAATTTPATTTTAVTAVVPAATTTTSTTDTSGAHQVGDIYYLTSDEKGAYVDLTKVGASAATGTVANDNRMYWQGAMPAVSTASYSMGTMAMPSYWMGGASTPTYWEGAMNYATQKASPAYEGGTYCGGSTSYYAGSVGVASSYWTGAMSYVNQPKSSATMSYLDGSMYGAGSPYAMGVIGGEYADGSSTTNIDNIPKGGTAPGKILVGEVGPEWMLSKSEYAKGGMDKWNWQKVGKDGPEVIDQAGGATILPFPVQPRDFMIDRIKGVYADGVDGVDETTIAVPTGFIAPTTTPLDAPKTSTISELVIEIRTLHRDNLAMQNELSAIKKQVQGGDAQANIDRRVGNSRLSSIDAKLGSSAITPARRAVG